MVAKRAQRRLGICGKTVTAHVQIGGKSYCAWQIWCLVKGVMQCHQLDHYNRAEIEQPIENASNNGTISRTKRISRL